MPPDVLYESAVFTLFGFRHWCGMEYLVLLLVVP